jgi:4-hydroxy-tetrahydrodipicolinate reductase
LGCGKTGALTAEVARERGHQAQTIDEDVNRNAAWLTAEHLRDVDVVIDFTTPAAVMANIEGCLHARKAMVVGTTGWYGELERVRTAVEQAGTGFVFGANFSYGVNLFFQIAQAAAPALAHGYTGHITETHHIQKKDAPSGTAITIQRVLERAAGIGVDITSEREGDVTGIHTLELNSASDRMVLTHEATSRRTFAEGAVLAAEWIAGKTGFYEFKDIFSKL